MNNKLNKNSILSVIIVSFFINIILILFGCTDPFMHFNNPSIAPEGKGSFSIILSDTSRTIMPATPNLSEFSLFCLNFIPISGGVSLHIDRTSTNLATPVYLEQGIYNLTVNAYKDNNKTQLTAIGTAENITITIGGNSNANVTLRALLSGGTGIFRWDISMPLDVISAEMLIIPCSEDGTSEQTVHLSQFTTTGNRTLNSGSYNLTISLKKADEKIVEWNELLYIYQNLESIYNYNFSNAHFDESHHTIIINYNDGVLTANGKTSVLHGGTMTQPDAPIRKGHIFKGWFTDNYTFNKSYNFDEPVIESFNLYAKWDVISPTSVLLENNSLILSVGARINLKATILPDDAFNKNISWSSSDTSVISVTEEGRITAHNIGFATITVATNDGQKKAYCEVDVYRPTETDRIIDRFKAIINDDSGEIIYSYTYNEFDYYYIYLGKMENIPLFSSDVTVFNGGAERNITYKVQVSESDSIQNTISTNIVEAISYIETNTTATDIGGKTSWKTYWEAGGTAGLELGPLKIGGGGKYSKTNSGEDSWREYISNTTTNSFKQIRSIENTISHAYNFTITTGYEDSVRLLSGDKPGCYRFSMYGDSDIYLFIIRDSITDQLYYEFREHAVPKSGKQYNWVFEYAETEKDFMRGGSGFDVDISLLKNLAKPELIFCTYGLSFSLINGNSAYSVSSEMATDAKVIIPTIHNELPVTTIAPNGFNNYTNMVSISIPDSVTSIGENAFFGTGIWNNTQNNVVYADKWAVGYKGTISNVLLRSDTRGIGDAAFYGYINLSSIVIPDGVMNISNNAFSGCSNLSNIIIPTSVRSIGVNAFSDCSSLSAVYYSGADNTEWNNKIVFQNGNTHLSNATRYYYCATSEARHRYSNDVVKQPNVLTTRYPNGTVNQWRWVNGEPKVWPPYIDLISVQGGKFQLGKTPNSTSLFNPWVTLTGFNIGKYQITQEQYQAVMGYNPSNNKKDNLASNEIQERRPVENLTWYDMIEFCNKLSEMEELVKVYTITGRTPNTGYPITSATVTANWNNNGYRLPTEAEWEFAAKGGNDTSNFSYSGSNTVGSVSWYSDNSSSKSHQVGLKSSNNIGIFDMSGNVWERCWDRHGSYTIGNITDPTGPTSGSVRVNRGGGYLSSSNLHKTTSRGDFAPGSRDSRTGFRIVRRP